MTEEMPKIKQSDLNIKVLVIIGIVLVGLIVGIILLFGSKKQEPTSITIEALIDKNDAKSITYSPGNSTSSNLSVGSEIELVYKFDNDSNKKVQWTLSDNNIAKIENNKVTGLSAGTVKIQAVYEGKKTVKSNFISLTFE